MAATSLRWVLGSGALLLSVLHATSASAQTTSRGGFGVSRFEPSERGSEWFALESLDLRGHLRPAVGIVGEYQYRPLAIYAPNGDLQTAVVNHLLVLHPGASLVLWDRLRVAANIPIQAYGEGTTATLGTTTFKAPSSDQSIGDLRLGADARLFGVQGDAITAALGVQVALPTGDADAYAGDGKLRVTPRATVAGDIGMFAYAAKLGFQYRGRSETFGSSPIGSELVFGASAGVRLADRKLLIGPELYGSTVTDGDQLFGRRTTPLEALLGGHYTAGSVRFGAGIGTGLTRGYGTPRVHVLAGIEWVPGADSAPNDRDGDGIVDADDACPETAGVASSDRSKHGCPAEEDRDHDGIVDRLDACPDTPGVRFDDPALNGCPDRDKDGIIDKLDACPDDPGPPSTDAKKNGCPDRDKDGVLDRVDACPDEPGPANADPKQNGCPDPDRDKDGVLNADDACPDEPGPKATDPKKNGCPKAFVKNGQIVILDQVKFKTSSSDILPGKDSQDVLDAVLGVLKSHSEIKKVRVEGHTDSRGDANMNKKLSAARAKSVVKWLVAHGIAADRLDSAGFGPDKPIDDNSTDAGRQNNRRVEFHIAE